MASSAWCKTQEELQLNGVVHSIAYCNETRNVFLCDSFNWTIEQLSRSSASSSSVLSLQPQKALNLVEPLQISNPTSVQIARKLNAMFVGCDSCEGISVVDRTNLQLVKKFAQNLSRDFDYIVVDETEDSYSGCTVYTSSTNRGIVTKLDYNNGSILNELSVSCPSNILLNDNKLYLICRIDSGECVQVIDKRSLEILSRIVLSGWSSLGGLCMNESGNVCVTACNDSNRRLVYSFDKEDKLVSQVQLVEFDGDSFVLDMVAVDSDFFILLQEPGPEFFLKRIKFNF